MRILILFFIVLGSVCHAELRTWTAVNGKEVEAEFVSNEKGIVKLKLKTGKVFEVPANKLSKEDNEFISSLAKPEGVNYNNTEGREGIIYLKGSDTPYTGKVFRLYKNGQKQGELTLKNGKIDGLWLYWYENGEKQQETNYKNGKKNGLQLGWHKNGQKAIEENYKDGKNISGKYWNSKGNPVANAGKVFAEANLKYEIKGDAVTITGCDRNASGKLVIPATIEGKTVASIAERAFTQCLLTSIMIPDSVTLIGNGAFQWCLKLTSITIPDSVNSIGDSAFSGCTSLKSITIPDSVTRIGDEAFLRCRNLSSITIPNSCVIGMGAFAHCSKLTTIVLNSGNTNYTVVDGILYNTEKTELHTYLAGNTRKEYTIPDSVTNITAYAFSGCLNLTSIKIPDSFTSIGADVFSNCTSLTNIRIPNGVTSIGNNAFYRCINLTSMTIPDSVNSIGDWTFRECTSLTSITIPDSVTSIGGSAFSECSNLTSITIPESVTSIGDYVFARCSNLTTIMIPDSVTSIGGSAFRYCTSLTSITIPDGVTSIGGSAFSECSKLNTVTFLGDAPKYNRHWEPFDKNTTIYRKPEAKGWGDTWAGRPVKYWNSKGEEVDSPKEAGTIYLEAYLQVEDAEKLEKESKFNEALRKYTDAKNILDNIAREHRGWRPEVLDYRRRKVNEAIDRCKKAEAE